MQQQQSPLQAEFGHLARRHVDVREIVDHSRNLVAFFRPIVAVLAGVKGLVRWEYGAYVTCSLLLMCNGSVLLLPAGFSVFCVIMLIAAVGAVGICHRRYRLLSKVFPRPVRSSADDDQSSQERIQEFRLLLVVIDLFMSRSTRLMVEFYSILKWDDIHLSLRYHLISCAYVLLLHFLPLRVFIVLILDFHVLRRPIEMSWCSWRERRSATNDAGCRDQLESSVLLPSTSEDAISLGSDTQADPGFHTDSDASEEIDSGGEELVQDAEQPGQNGSGVHDETKGSVNGSRVPGVVGKILELKKRRQQYNSQQQLLASQQTTTEKCTSCSVIFSVFLKRKHICNHCGQHFCSRCCSNKVPRSIFGATAPAAQTETVAVCLLCYNDLVGGAGGGGAGAPKEKDKSS